MPTETGDLLTAVETTAAKIKDVRAQYSALMAQMRDAVRAADAEHGRNEIVRAAQGGLSRREVYKVLGAADLLAEAKKIAGRYWTVYEATPGVVRLTADVADEHGFDTEDFENGTVQRDAHHVLRRLRNAGIEAIGDDPAAILGDYGEVELRRSHAANKD